MGTAVMPSYRDLRRNIASLLLDRGEWAGCPVPIEGLTLDIEKNYPYRDVGDIGKEVVSTDSELDANGLKDGEAFVNSWYSTRREAHVYVIRNAEGRSVVFTYHEKRYARRFELQISSMRACWAHDLAAETAAIKTLSEHISKEQFIQYTLLGQFIETSKRSGVIYVFRRARPTVAMRPKEERTAILAVLCMHPIGYYRETFVGAMTPTDDVIAHLLLMRGDEPMYWRRCNQHNPAAPEASI